MKKKLLSLLLALALCLGLTPAASAANTSLPDWYFLIAIFKNVDADGTDDKGVDHHIKYSMTQEELSLARQHAVEFESRMDQFGVMRAHVDVVEIDAAVTSLHEYDRGSYLSAEDATPLLTGKVDLDKYDHVTCVVCLDDFSTSYLGVTATAFENGAGHSCIDLRNKAYCDQQFKFTPGEWPPMTYIHEFLHFMERLDKKWGAEFDLHTIEDKFYPKEGAREIYRRPCYTDIILDRAKGEAGTGVHPAVWQYPPHVLRTMRVFEIPSGVTGIGEWAFNNCATMTKLTIPSSVTSIGQVAFRDCTSLAEVTIAPGPTSIGDWAFQNCSALTRISVPSGVASIGENAFRDCSSLTELTTAPGLTSIGTWAFGRCPALTKVTLPASVTSIGYAAFWDAGITDVYYGGTEEQWKAIQIDEYNGALTKANIHYNSSTTQEPPATVPTVTVDKIPASGTAYASTQNITIDGKAVRFEAYALKNENGDLTNYVKLRDVAVALNGTAAQFEVGYDGTISLTTKTSYTGGSEMGTPFSGDRAYRNGTQAVKVNGRPVEMTAITLYDSDNNGYNYFKLRDLGAVLGFQVGYSNEAGISIDTGR